MIGVRAGGGGGGRGDVVCLLVVLLVASSLAQHRMWADVRQQNRVFLSLYGTSLLTLINS